MSEISKTISRKFDLPANEDLVCLALDQLKKEKLIANGEEVVSNFAGMSRREVIKKVGFGTMIALSFVSSLVAPTAISAQSRTCNTGTACTCPNGTGTGNTCAATVCMSGTGCICRNVVCNNGGNNCMGTCST